MAKKINLDMTSVENREMRLGTIIAWDGAASELVEKSDYEGRKEKKKGNDIHAQKHRGCPGNGSKACRLCELKTPLNQQTRKLFENDMYFIRTEKGNVAFHPETVSNDDIITDNEE